jgi:hypothetical protein
VGGRGAAAALAGAVLFAAAPSAFAVDAMDGVEITGANVFEIPKRNPRGAPWDPNRLEPGNPASAMGPDGYLRVDSPDLPDIHGEDIVLQVRVYPSFTNRYVAGVRNARHGPAVFRAEYRTNPWDHDVAMKADAAAGPAEAVKHPGPQAFQEAMRRGYAAGWSKSPVAYCESSLDPALAERIRAVWQAMILDAKPPTGHSTGLDGATYHFSMPLAGGGHGEAHTWSPPVGSRPRQLVDIADGMVRYCETARPEVEREGLETAVAALEKAAAEAATASPDPR